MTEVFFYLHKIKYSDNVSNMKIYGNAFPPIKYKQSTFCFYIGKEYPMANWWNQYPWRVIQPNFRQIDTVNFDEDRFLEYSDKLLRSNDDKQHCIFSWLTLSAIAEYLKLLPTYGPRIAAMKTKVKERYNIILKQYGHSNQQ